MAPETQACDEPNLRPFFDKNFDICESPEKLFKIAVCPDVDHTAIRNTIKDLGLTPEDVMIMAGEADLNANKIELRNSKTDLEFLKEIANGDHGHVFAIVGRTKMDSAIQELCTEDSTFLQKLKQMGVESIGKLGNGVSLDTQKTFETGQIGFRTPVPNSHSVEYWGEMTLQAIEAGDMSPEKLKDKLGNNPVAQDNFDIKNGTKGKLLTKASWNKDIAPDETNIGFLPFDQYPPDSELEKIAEKWRDKKVVVIGLGDIGRNHVLVNPRCKYADVYYYDKNPAAEVPHGKKAKTQEEALKNADLVIVQADTPVTIINEEDLELMNDNAILVNLARGVAVDQKALFRKINSTDGRKLRFASDVWEDEKNLDKALIEMTNDQGEIDLDKLPMEEWADRHYSVALMLHKNVIATGHSAAGEVHGKAENAKWGVWNAWKYFKEGGIRGGFKAAPASVEVPHKALVQQGDTGPEVINNEDKDVFMIEILHDAKVEGVIEEARGKLTQVLIELGRLPEGGKINKLIPTGGKSRRFGNKKNSVFAEIFSLPRHGENGGSKLTNEESEKIINTLEEISGIYAVRVFNIIRKDSQ